MTFEARLDLEAAEFLESLDSKSQKIIKKNLRKLEEDPHPRPQNSLGDVEKVTVGGEEVYRMHISRTYTAFYVIKDQEQQVIVTEIVDIDTAHKMYD
ncbi:MAG: type II toxin-antitoxin system RelE/ParE family toxin [Candidatus Nanohaloarchaea archaeon]